MSKTTVPAPPNTVGMARTGTVLHRLTETWSLSWRPETIARWACASIGILGDTGRLHAKRFQAVPLCRVCFKYGRRQGEQRIVARRGPWTETRVG